jgi:hypothetical protein
MLEFFMSFDKLFSWVKGGLIGVAVGVLIFLLTFWNFLEMLAVLLAAPGIVMSLFICGYESGNYSSCGTFVSVLFSVLTFFVVGALVGWIVGKFKRK